MTFATFLRLSSALVAGLAAPLSPLHAQDGTADEFPVVVVRATYACFSDMVRVTGFAVPRREAVVNVDTEGAKVAELLVHEGDVVAENQELARLTPPSTPGNTAAKPASMSLRAPAAGLITKVNTAPGAPASPQAEPMFRIAIGIDIEVNAEVPGIHILKLKPGATATISRDHQPDLVGSVRIVAPEIDRKTQLGHARIALNDKSALRVGTFARVAIDARQSCGVSVPRSAIDHQAVQVVNGNTVETRQVRAGLTSDNNIEILQGLKQDEVVIADAGTSLHDGDRVKPMFSDEADQLQDIRWH